MREKEKTELLAMTYVMREAALKDVEIEWKYKEGSIWHPVPHTPLWNWLDCDYRIKPPEEPPIPEPPMVVRAEYVRGDICTPQKWGPIATLYECPIIEGGGRLTSLIELTEEVREALSDAGILVGGQDE